MQVHIHHRYEGLLEKPPLSATSTTIPFLHSRPGRCDIPVNGDEVPHVMFRDAVDINLVPESAKDVDKVCGLAFSATSKHKISAARSEMSVDDGLHDPCFELGADKLRNGQERDPMHAYDRRCIELAWALLAGRQNLNLINQKTEERQVRLSKLTAVGNIPRWRE